MKKSSPYEKLDAGAYWKSGVADKHILQPEKMGLYRRKFEIKSDDVVVTAGSCFAQHIARYMRSNGFNVLDTERAPIGLPANEHAKYGYGLYSARHGNIYTSRQLLQLLRESVGKFEPQNWIWPKGDLFIDGLRPSVEPDGLETPALVVESRKNHVRRFKLAIRKANCMVFTLGLTETWVDKASGTVFPTAPGTIAGDFDDSIFGFHNLTCSEVLADMKEFMRLARKLNENLKFLLTVSPVPLTATASGNHVMLASTYSKSVLRSVAGELYSEYDFVDYFPSYEIITSPFSSGMFFAGNKREVMPEGVDVVMKAFFKEHQLKGASSTKTPRQGDVVCEEMLLEAFQ